MIFSFVFVEWLMVKSKYVLQNLSQDRLHGRAIYVAAAENNADTATGLDFSAQKRRHPESPRWLHHQFQAVK
jgi:hypothetical protein